MDMGATVVSNYSRMFETTRFGEAMLVQTNYLAFCNNPRFGR